MQNCLCVAGLYYLQAWHIIAGLPSSIGLVAGQGVHRDSWYSMVRYNFIMALQCQGTLVWILSMHLAGSMRWNTSDGVVCNLHGHQAYGKPILMTQSKL